MTLSLLTELVRSDRHGGLGVIVEAYPAKSADAPAVTDAAAVTDASAVTDDHLDQSQGSLSGMPRMHNWDSRGTRSMTVCISRAWMRGSVVYSPGHLPPGCH